MPTAIYTANLDLIASGIMPGVNEEHVPLWVTAKDVVMEASGVRPAPGLTTPYVDNGYFDEQAGDFDDYAGLFDEAGTRVFLTAIGDEAVKGIHVQKQSDGRILAVWGTDTALYTFNGTSVVDASRASPYSGTSSASDIVDTTQWSFAQWGDWVLATNGADTPQVLKYGTAAEFADIANFPVSSAQIVRVLGPHALFFNCAGTWAPGPAPAASNQIVFCAEDDIEAYDPGVAATAGELTIRDFAGPILAVEHLGGELIAYGESSAHVIRYGGQFLITAQKGAQGIRPAGKNAVASIGAKHFLLSQNGIFATDGVSIQPAAYPALGAWMETVVDWDQRSRIAHMVDVRRSQITWSLPGIYDDVVLTYNWLTDKLTTMGKPFTAGTRVESLWKPLVGFFNGELKMLVDVPLDRAPELMTKPLMVGGRTTHAFLDAFVTRWSGEEAVLQVRYGERHDDIDAAPWETVGVISGKESLQYLMRETMFCQFKLTSPGWKWLLSGIELVGTGGGGRL